MDSAVVKAQPKSMVKYNLMYFLNDICFGLNRIFDVNAKAHNLAIF